MTTMTGPAVIDFARLRHDRRRRLFDAMAGHDLDALMLGRSGDVAFASGAHQLWTSGSRPFGPACIVLRESGAIHLLSTWDEGIPEDIPHENLFGLVWNPINLIASLRAIPGLGQVRRIGTDSSSPGFSHLVAAVAPDAVLVDAGPALREARAVKGADELACIQTATTIAEAALTAMVDALRPGVTERELVAIYAARIAELGATTPPSEGVVCATPRHGRVALRRVPTDRPVGPGELVVLDPGALFAGYEGGVGRTWVAGGTVTAGQTALASRCRLGLDAVVEQCRAGRRGEDLRRAWVASGAPLPAAPLAYGLGLGVEPPVIGLGVGADTPLVAGSVLAVQGWVSEEGVGGFFERDLVLVGDAEPLLLSRYGAGPAAA